MEQIVYSELFQHLVSITRRSRALDPENAMFDALDTTVESRLTGNCGNGSCEAGRKKGDNGLRRFEGCRLNWILYRLLSFQRYSKDIYCNVAARNRFGLDRGRSILFLLGCMMRTVSRFFCQRTMVHRRHIVRLCVCTKSKANSPTRVQTEESQNEER
jgi:hypothetical protein